MRLKTGILVVGFVFASVLGIGRAGFALTLLEPLTVPAGHDFFVSPDRGSRTRPLDLPEGFFGAVSGIPSDAISNAAIQFGGQPLSSFPAGVPNSFGALFVLDRFNELGQLVAHGVVDPRIGGAQMPLGIADTIVQRHESANLPAIGSEDTIPIEILALSLHSVSPITVTYGKGNPTDFDVVADLDPASRQLMGAMTLTRTGDKSGTFDSLLPVNFRLVFSHADTHVGPFVLPAGDLLTADDVRWRVPEPYATLLFGSGMAAVAAIAWRRRRYSR